MIEQLKIQNFQRHSRLKIDFERVTTIVGPTDCGKSAIVRALRWICSNSPAGAAFIREGSKGCTSQILVDGHSVRRRRGKDTNEYVLDEQTFKAFGSDVPAPIKDTLKIEPINFQNQHDSPFWFSETAGQVSKNLNSIVDLELIDESMTRINKVYNKARIETEVSERRLKEAAQKRRELKWVKEADKQYKEVERHEKQWKEYKWKIDELLMTCERVEDIKSIRDQANAALEDLRGVVSLSDYSIGLSERARALDSVISDAKKQSSIKSPDTSILDEAAHRYESTSEETKRLEQLLSRIDAGRISLEKAAKEFKKVEEDIHNKTEGICPLCGKQM